jgi:hypothetical protein
MITCDLFESQASLLDSSYQVRSCVATSSFELFLSAVEDKPVQISKSNYRDLVELCKEFGFSGLASSFSAFERLDDARESEVLLEVAESEEQCLSQQWANALLEGEVSSLHSRRQEPEMRFDSSSFLRGFLKHGDDYEVLGELGKGTFVVWSLVRERSSDDRFALGWNASTRTGRTPLMTGHSSGAGATVSGARRFP